MKTVDSVIVGIIIVYFCRAQIRLILYAAEGIFYIKWFDETNLSLQSNGIEVINDI